MTLLALWLTTFGVCVAGAVIPFINTEIYLLSVSALTPRSFVAPLVVAATVGQMVGKIFMFYGGRGLLRLPRPALQQRVSAVRARLDAHPHAAKMVLFSSATFGLPPLYVMSIVCGTIGMSLASFFFIGTIGRLIHFAVVAMVPQYVKSIWG